MNNERSKKNKDNIISAKEKAKLWNIFDTEVAVKQPLECVYRAVGDREFCEMCQSNLAFSDEGILEDTEEELKKFVGLVFFFKVKPS